MPKKSKAKNVFQGRWRITWMDEWDQEFVDEEVEGYFEFEPKGMGSFQFGYVRGQIDYRPSARDGRPCRRPYLGTPPNLDVEARSVQMAPRPRRGRKESRRRRSS